MFSYATLNIFDDSVFDGMTIRIFGKWGALLSLLQQFAYYMLDAVLCFVVGSFSTMIFLYIGIACLCCVPLLWVYDWPELPLVNLKGIWRDFRRTFWAFVVGVIYFINSTFSEAMMPYFCTFVSESDSEAGFTYGIYGIGLLLGVSFGQYLFNGLRYRHCLVLALMIETLGTFIVMFITSEVHFAWQMLLFLLCGGVESITDSIVQTYLVDTCDITRTPTFCYSVFQSCYEAGGTIGFTVYPQVAENLAWRDFWMANVMQSGGVMMLFAICFYVVPAGWNDPVLNRIPSLRWREICEACQGALCGGNATEEEAKDEKDDLAILAERTVPETTSVEVKEVPIGDDNTSKGNKSGDVSGEAVDAA
jgi:hypothetical protein